MFSAVDGSDELPAAVDGFPQGHDHRGDGGAHGALHENGGLQCGVGPEGEARPGLGLLTECGALVVTLHQTCWSSPQREAGERERDRGGRDGGEREKNRERKRESEREGEVREREKERERVREVREREKERESEREWEREKDREKEERERERRGRV